MKKILLPLLAAGLCASPVSAAEHYVSGNIGISAMSDVNFLLTEGILVSNTIYETKFYSGSGLTTQGAIGCSFGAYRVEGEIGYQRNSANKLISSYQAPSIRLLNTETDLSGSVSVLSFLANGYYDFDTYGVQPYLTAGAGAARIYTNSIHAVNDSDGASSHNTAFAYQIGAGVAIPVSNTVKIDARYRYFATAKFTNPFQDISGISSVANDVNITSHSVLLGMSVGF